MDTLVMWWSRSKFPFVACEFWLSKCNALV